MTQNSKSDLTAKDAYMSHLKKDGYQDVKPAGTPSDITAIKDGKKWYFEIKMTTKNDKYFGAATQTEWEQAFKTPETFKFVVALKNDKVAEGYEFFELKPEDFIQYSTVPPFKIFFNIDMKELRGKEEVRKKNSGNRKRKAVKFTHEVFETLQQTWNKIRL